ncbi:MAG TPA: hypothetical protein VE093_30540 [Polyangiaceae bacterium]|nr:hypothetical protein [Polyangiaceae bacterium]
MESSSEDASNVVREVRLSATHRVLFIDEGNGDVAVAEMARMDEAPVVTTMIRQKGATPLEIFMATANRGEDIPEILVDNHRYIAAMQGREDLEPRHDEALPSTLQALAWTQESGVTACDATGWEGPNGVWGNPTDSWDQQFHNATDVSTKNTIYPKTMSIMHNALWNNGSGSFHTHGACLKSDNGADKKITFTIEGIDKTLFNVGGDNWVTFTSYISIAGTKTTSTITNVNNSAATFRHSAAAWVPNPQ